MDKSIEVIDIAKRPDLRTLSVDGKPFVAILRDKWGREMAAAGGSSDEEAVGKLMVEQSISPSVRIVRH